MEFRQEMLGMPTPEPPGMRELRKLATTYHEATDAYDLALAADTEGKLYGLRFGLSQRHAMALDEVMMRRAAELGFSPTEWHKERNWTGWWRQRDLTQP